MYDDIAKGYNELHGAEQRRKLERLLEVVDLDGVVSVADIGCGTAHLSKYFLDQEYIGIDPSQALLDESPSEVMVLCASGEDVPLPDESQDLVVSLTALHNYQDFRLGVKELKRIAKDLVLVGVLRKSSLHDQILDELRTNFRVEHLFLDAHDSLLVLRKS